MTEPLRILIVNHCHPDTPHICGQRAARFADALARRGHAVALLTQSLKRDDVPPNPAVIKAHLKALLTHPDGTAALIAPPPAPAPLLERMRAGTLPPLLSKGLVALNYGLRGSVFPDWREGTMRYVAMIADVFRPQVCWGIFGNTEALHLARAVSRFAGSRWIIDVKDPWTAFIPEAFRANLAIRYANAHGLTAFSEAHAAEAARFWPHLKATVVRSGIAQGLLDHPPSGDAATPDAPFTIGLMGGLYEDDTLATLIAGLGRFLDTLPEAERDRVTVRYAGSDKARLAAALDAAALPCRADLRDHGPLPETLARMAGADVLLHLRGARVLFHHKVFELFALGRPILAVPGESAETAALAAEVGASLTPCPDAAALAEALAASHRAPRRAAAVDRSALARYTWDAQAAVLEGVFREVIAR